MANFDSMVRGMFAQMQPEQIVQMVELSKNLDPSMMEGLMRSAGVDADRLRLQEASENIRSMSPEQMRARAAWVHARSNADQQLSLSNAKSLKDEGNRAVKAGRPAESLEKYQSALEQMQGYQAPEASELRLQLLNNAAFCHLKLRQFDRAAKASQEALAIDPKSFKAHFRRGQARAELGSLGEALADVREAARLAPHDKGVAEELARLRSLLEQEPDGEPCSSSTASTCDGASEPASSESSLGSSAAAAEAEAEPDAEQAAPEEAGDAAAAGLELAARRTQVGGGFAILLAALAVATTATASRCPRASGFLAGATCAALGAFGWSLAARR